jgi:hypothetical protein
MRKHSSRRHMHSAAAPLPRLAAPLVGLALVLALFIVACDAGGGSGSSSASGSSGNQTVTFANPPAAQTTPPVATTVGTPQTVAPGIPGVTPTQPGKIPAFSADDMANFVLRRGFPNVGEDGTPTVTQKLFIPNSQVEYLTGYTTGLHPTSTVGYVELQGSFNFPTPPDVPPIHLSVAYMLFNVVNGDIIGWGGLPKPSNPNQQPTPVPAQPTATPAPAQPTPTTPPQQPTATPVPQNPPKLSVSPTKTTEFCANNDYPNNNTVANAGAGTLNWSATTPSGITLTPSSGALDSGGAQVVTLSGSFTSTTSFVIQFTSNGGSASVTVDCTTIG